MDKLLLYVSKNEKILQKKNDGITVYNAVITPEKKETRANIFTGDNEYILQQIVENKLVFDEIIIDNYEDILVENNNYVYAYLKCLNKNGRLIVENVSSERFTQFSDLYTLKEDDNNIIIEQTQNEKNINCVNIINFSYKYKALANKSCMGVNELLHEVRLQRSNADKLDKWYHELEKGAKSTYEELQKSQEYIKELENICKNSENEKNNQKSYIEELEQICKTSEANKIEQQKYIEELERSVKKTYMQLDEKSKYVNELENICKEQEQVIHDKDEYFNKMKDAHENEITQLVDENIRKIESTNKIHEDAVKKLLKIENSIWYKVFNKFYKY